MPFFSSGAYSTDICQIHCIKALHVLKGWQPFPTSFFCCFCCWCFFHSSLCCFVYISSELGTHFLDCYIGKRVISDSFPSYLLCLIVKRGPATKFLKEKPYKKVNLSHQQSSPHPSMKDEVLPIYHKEPLLE